MIDPKQTTAVALLEEEHPGIMLSQMALDATPRQVAGMIATLIGAGRLIVFHPPTLYGEDDLTVSVNGDAVQLNVDYPAKEVVA